MDHTMEDGLVFIFTGTNGSGRRTIARQIASDLGFSPIISYTTRTPRPKEVEGRDYRFIARKAFIDADINGEFFQTAEIDGHFYGIKRKDVNETLRNNPHAYVVVNRYAANMFKYEFGERAIRIFIYASKQTIHERLEARDVPLEIIDTYMNHYIEEVSYRKECELVFENTDLQETVSKVKKAMMSYIPASTS
jgi:guanylate kinase